MVSVNCAIRNTVRAALLMTAALSTASDRATANDGGIALGGTPGLLKGHPSIAMTSEVVKIVVRDLTLTADCRFVFTNHGPACTVRVGFPDRGIGAMDPDEEEDAA